MLEDVKAHDPTAHSHRLKLRPAEPDDALDVAGVHIRSWQIGYRGLLPDAYLDQLRAEQRAKHYDFATDDPAKPRTIVAVGDGAIRGFATTMPARDSDRTGWGELCALYVDPPYWSRGIGHALVTAARQHMISMGHRSACLWLLEGNARVGRFYCKNGWSCEGLRRTDTVWGAVVNEVRYLLEL
jgi:GNAT superfamily N-acetyltransferase